MSYEQLHQYNESDRPERHWASNRGFDEETIATIVGRAGAVAGPAGIFMATLEAQFGPEVSELASPLAPVLASESDPPAVASYIQIFCDAASKRLN